MKDGSRSIAQRSKAVDFEAWIEQERQLAAWCARREAMEAMHLSLSNLKNNSGYPLDSVNHAVLLRACEKIRKELEN
jgi:hypothetical protein